MVSTRPTVTAYGTPREAPLGWLDGTPPLVLSWYGLPQSPEHFLETLRDEFGAVVHWGPDESPYQWAAEYAEPWSGNIFDYVLVLLAQPVIILPEADPPQMPPPWQHHMANGWAGRYMTIWATGYASSPYSPWVRGAEWLRDQVAPHGIVIDPSLRYDINDNNPRSWSINADHHLAAGLSRVVTNRVLGTRGGEWLASRDGTARRAFLTTVHVGEAEWLIGGIGGLLFQGHLLDHYGFDFRPFLRNLWSVRREPVPA